MYKTKNDVPEKVRTQVSAILQARLADSIDLMQQAKQAHWNVKGPNFIALHELFDKISEDTEEYVDSIAERIVQYGGVAEGTIRVASQKSSLKEYPLTLSTGKEHAAALSNALAAYGELIRKAIAQTAELSDADTSDLFTEISREVDKYLWFVEAHIQAET